jgi:hypothetical protein
MFFFSKKIPNKVAKNIIIQIFLLIIKNFAQKSKYKKQKLQNNVEKIQGILEVLLRLLISLKAFQIFKN